MNNAFANIDDSDDSVLIDDHNANSLKLTTFGEDEYYGDDVMYQGFRAQPPKKKKEKKKRKKPEEENKKISTRKIVNLPASQPYIKVINGEDRLCFKYNTKVSESAMNAMPKADLEECEFAVRFDLDSVDISKLNEKFKAENCVYPRANLPINMYAGNRWNYETECNRLAWQFVSLNSGLLYGKKGLIQRAVDSYRNITKTRQNSKFFKGEAFYGDIEKRKQTTAALPSVCIQWVARGVTKKCKIHTAVEPVGLEMVPDEFRSKYAVLDEQFDVNSFGQERWELKNKDNILGVKIAYLNAENTSFLNAVKAIGVYAVIKKAVDAYKAKKQEKPAGPSEETDAYDIVNDTLDKAFDEVMKESTETNSYLTISESNV